MMLTVTTPDGDTRVDVWSDRLGRFVPTPARRVRCHSCGNAAQSEFYWDNGMLVCRCGEQFTVSEDGGGR